MKARTVRWRHLAAAAAVLLVATGGLIAGSVERAAAIVSQVPLTGLVEISDTDEATSWYAGATVTCPYGKKVVGTGWTTSPASSQLRLRALVPSERSVYVTVEEAYEGFVGSWSVTVRAMCADNPPGWSLVSSWSEMSSEPYRTARATCPGQTRPLGAGFEQTESDMDAVVTDISLNLFDVAVAAYEDEGGTAEQWRVRAYAICADPPAGWRVLTSDNQTSYPSTSEYTACTGDTTAISSGGDLNSAWGQVVLTALRTLTYDDDGDGEVSHFGMARAQEDDTGAPDGWELINSLVCAEASS
jgi:hypothetical protein